MSQDSQHNTPYIYILFFHTITPNVKTYYISTSTYIHTWIHHYPFLYLIWTEEDSSNAQYTYVQNIYLPITIIIKAPILKYSICLPQAFPHFALPSYICFFPIFLFEFLLPFTSIDEYLLKASHDGISFSFLFSFLFHVMKIPIPWLVWILSCSCSLIKMVRDGGCPFSFRNSDGWRWESGRRSSS